MSEFICGIKPTFGGLKIQPCMPNAWSGVEAVRKFRGETYRIRYVRTGRSRVVCDGEEVEILPLTGKGSVHDVLCEM